MTPNTDALALSLAECRMTDALTEPQAFSQMANHARALERDLAAIKERARKLCRVLRELHQGRMPQGLVEVLEGTEAALIP